MPQPRFHRARTFLQIVRFVQWRHFLLLPLAALCVEPRPMSVRWPDLALGIGAAVAVLGHAYGLNAVADRHSDVSRLKNPLIGQHTLTAGTRWSLAAMILLGLLCGALAAPTPRLATLVAFVAGTVYSVGPRTKSVFVLGTLTNVLIFAPLLLVGVGSASLEASLGATHRLLLMFVVVLLQNQLVHEIADAPEDRLAGDRTTALVLGDARARQTCVALGLGGAALCLAVDHTLGSWWAAAGMVAGGLVALRPVDAASLRVHHRFVALGMGAVLFGLEVLSR